MSRLSLLGRHRSSAALPLPLVPALPLCFVLVLLVGCGGADTAQVAGRVTMTDGTAPQGAIRVIRFEPTGDSQASVRKAAFADLEDDGSFEMLTRKYGDGVYRGKYKVTFTVFKTVDGRESAIPEKYTSAETTPFEIEVTKNVRDLHFELETP